MTTATAGKENKKKKKKKKNIKKQKKNRNEKGNKEGEKKEKRSKGRAVVAVEDEVAGGGRMEDARTLFVFVSETFLDSGVPEFGGFTCLMCDCKN
jgi:hypothetical protein